MKDGATKGFEQAYNAQAAGDSTVQVIVAALVTQQANDKQQLKPMGEKVRANCGRLPEKVSADAGYCNTKQLTEVMRSGVDLDVSPDRQKHGSVLTNSALETIAESNGGGVQEMRQKASTTYGQAVYQWRKAIVEPVFGQIKEGRGFRRFAFRGLAKVSAEWATHLLDPQPAQALTGQGATVHGLMRCVRPLRVAPHSFPPSLQATAAARGAFRQATLVSSAQLTSSLYPLPPLLRQAPRTRSERQAPGPGARGDGRSTASCALAAAVPCAMARKMARLHGVAGLGLRVGNPRELLRKRARSFAPRPV
jgi:hypothetical protein